MVCGEKEIDSWKDGIEFSAVVLKGGFFLTKYFVNFKVRITIIHCKLNDLTSWKLRDKESRTVEGKVMHHLQPSAAGKILINDD